MNLPRDYSACARHECPLRQDCWRSRYSPDDMPRRFANYEPGRDGKCWGFIPVDDE